VKQLFYLVFLIAALQGAGGVTLAAAAAHMPGGGTLAVASQMLTMHAGAGIGLALLLCQPLPRLALFATAALALQSGVTLFALDIASRNFLESRLFPYAAPIGGGLTILSWVALACLGFAGLIPNLGKRD
jgi:uncharacterized membrane protein YgdD (TMEM256/DUF423 family)